MEHGIVLVLPHAIVGMHMDISHAEAVLLKVVVEQAYGGVGSLPSVTSLVNEILHLSYQRLATDTENPTFSEVLGNTYGRVGWKGSEG